MVGVTSIHRSSTGRLAPTCLPQVRHTGLQVGRASLHVGQPVTVSPHPPLTHTAPLHTKRTTTLTLEEIQQFFTSSADTQAQAGQDTARPWDSHVATALTATPHYHWRALQETRINCTARDCRLAPAVGTNRLGNARAWHCLQPCRCALTRTPQLPSGPHHLHGYAVGGAHAQQYSCDVPPRCIGAQQRHT